jgi:carotenoid cleavage dioxygenase-like enzyme
VCSTAVRMARTSRGRRSTPATFDLGSGGLLGSTLPSLERWKVDPKAKTLEAAALDDETVEFPRIDDSLAGRSYRYGYCTVMRRDEGTDAFTGLIRYDLARDEARRWDPGPGLAPSEPVFVRDPDGRADDEGWVLAVVYDPARDASDVVILDASSFGAKPEAVIHLPCRVPFGFHGSWVPASSFR